MPVSGLPFDDFRALLGRLPGPDGDAAARTEKAFVSARGEAASLGRIERIAMWLSAWTGRTPQVMRPQVALFAGTHGISRRLGRIDATGDAMARVERIASGGAPVSRVCSANDFGLKVFDLALDLPTGDFTEEAALDERGCAATIAFGMEAIAGGTDLLCIGDLGPDNVVPARAVLAALSGEALAGFSGGRAQEVIDEALALHGDHLSDPLEILRRLGGREIAAIAGAIMAARMEKVPVLLSGLATTAAAAVLHRANSAALDHCLLADVTGAGHRSVATRIGLEPLLDFGLEDGEGAGAALAAGIVKAAARVAAGAAEAQRPPMH